MMMFSKKMEYGYMIIQELKETAVDKTIVCKDILKNIDVPYNMGLVILSELSRKKIIISSRGKNKGYYLKDKEMTLLELFESLENATKIEEDDYKDDGYKEKIKLMNNYFLKELKNMKIIDW